MKKDVKREARKRRHEFTASLLLALVFLFLVWVEIRLFSFGKQLPLNQSIFFFGLVNLNLIILLGLSFFVLRNLFKAFVTQKRGWIGNSLKSRLIATFLGFSIVPTVFMFVIALFYINSSFDRWFSEKMQGVLKSALEVNKDFYSSEKKRNFNAAIILTSELEKQPPAVVIKPIIDEFRKQHSLDAVEVYAALDNERIISVVDDETVPIIPPVTIELLKRVINEKVEIADIKQMSQGQLVRVLVPFQHRPGAVAIATFIPISVIAKMDDVAVAYEEMRDINYPIKSIYIVVLVLMTGMILVCSVWFGLYIAKHLSFALEQLGEATQKVAEGKYHKVEIGVAESEVQQLGQNFNLMVDALRKSRKETSDANANLKVTLRELDQRRRYMQVVLSNVSTGVISLDQNDHITMVNDKAAELLRIDHQQYFNRPAQDILGEKYYKLYQQLITKMKTHHLSSVEQEVVFDLDDSSMPSILKISSLYGDRGEDIGKVVAFDDLTEVLQGQRAVAWKEVARRIAHEVKNPLTPIKLSAQRLQKKFSSEIHDPAFASCINMIIEQTDSLKHLINEFSQFARLPETRSRLADLNEMIEKVISFYEQAHRNIRFVGKMDTHIEPFFFDPEQLKRAVFNLVENAVHATAGVAVPTINVETLVNTEINIVTISISDNGKIVSDTEMKRMFEPYYSNRPGGSGLGLTIVKKTVEDHNGFVRLVRNQPRGLMVMLELPYTRV